MCVVCYLSTDRELAPIPFDKADRQLNLEINETRPACLTLQILTMKVLREELIVYDFTESTHPIRNHTRCRSRFFVGTWYGTGTGHRSQNQLQDQAGTNY